MGASGSAGRAESTSKELLPAGASDENLRLRLDGDDVENPALDELMAALAEG